MIPNLVLPRISVVPIFPRNSWISIFPRNPHGSHFIFPRNSPDSHPIFSRNSWTPIFPMNSRDSHPVFPLSRRLRRFWLWWIPSWDSRRGPRAARSRPGSRIPGSSIPGWPRSRAGSIPGSIPAFSRSSPTFTCSSAPAAASSAAWWRRASHRSGALVN